MTKITMSKQGLMVPDNPSIPFIAGDGIGPEVWQAAVAVFDAAVAKAYHGKRQIDWVPLLAGQSAFEQTGQWLPDQTLSKLKEYLVGIKGPLTTPIGEGHRSINVTLRQKLDLYACWRPVNYYDGVNSPLKHPERVSIDVFRENTEDTYIGIEAPYDSDDAKQFKALLEELGQLTKVRFPATTSFGIKPISKDGSQRIIQSALNFAVEYHRKHVTIVHKGNIMKDTEGSFCRWGYQLAEATGNQFFTMNQYRQIKATDGTDEANRQLSEAQSNENVVIVNDMIADNFFQQALLHPEQFDVVVTTNLNGDYISDDLAAEVGGIGIAPSSNINYQSGHAIFEATHGTAPDIAGQGLANPLSLILSGAMMFSYLGWSKVNELIINSVKAAIKNQFVTKDLATSVNSHVLTTNELSKYLVNHI
ncbi:NADP-dependent isocitrate dehydrogenase [Lactobacillaceae bacterium Scapto_B20]